MRTPVGALLLQNPLTILVLAGLGAAAYAYYRATRPAAPMVGSALDPKGAFSGNNQGSFISSFNGLLSADTNWNIVDAKGAIAGDYAFTPLKPATQTGILTPFTPFTAPSSSLWSGISSIFSSSTTPNVNPSTGSPQQSGSGLQDLSAFNF